MTWRPLQRQHAILPAEVVHSGAGETPQEAFRSIVDSVRRIDYDRPRVLLDIDPDFSTSSATYTDVLTGLVIRTSDDIATTTAVGISWRLRLDARIAELDVRARIYDTGGTLVQTLTASNGSATFDVIDAAATIAVAADTTYRVDIDARLNGAGIGYLTALRISEETA